MKKQWFGAPKIGKAPNTEIDTFKISINHRRCSHHPCGGGRDQDKDLWTSKCQDTGGLFYWSSFFFRVSFLPFEGWPSTFWRVSFVCFEIEGWPLSFPFLQDDLFLFEECPLSFWRVTFPFFRVTFPLISGWPLSCFRVTLIRRTPVSSLLCMTWAVTRLNDKNLRRQIFDRFILGLCNAMDPWEWTIGVQPSKCTDTCVDVKQSKPTQESMVEFTQQPAMAAIANRCGNQSYMFKQFRFKP